MYGDTREDMLEPAMNQLVGKARVFLQLWVRDEVLPGRGREITDLVEARRLVGDICVWTGEISGIFLRCARSCSGLLYLSDRLGD